MRLPVETFLAVFRVQFICSTISLQLGAMPNKSASRSQKPTQEDDNFESHPLFLTRVPSHQDFKENPLLSALAALIDEDEGVSYKPVRRQRTQRRVDPCKKPSSLPSESPSRFQLCTPKSPNNPVEVPDTGGVQRDSRAYGSAEQPVSTFKGDLETTAMRTSPSTSDNPPTSTSGMGELQICMRLWSMK